MFVLKRNQIIITALVIMIAVAGYLNYIDGNAKPRDSMLLDDGGLISRVNDEEYMAVSSSQNADALVFDGNVLENPMIATGDTQATAPEGSTSASKDPGEAIFVSTTVDLSYFVQAKLDREQSRAKQKEILNEMINNTNIDQKQRAECADTLLEIHKRIEKESAAEAMIEAKGFKEVFVRIDDNTVDVVVNKEALTDAEIAQIEDIVKRKTGMDTANIRISPMKKK